MQEKIFDLEMAKTAEKTCSELNPLKMAAYWEEFQNWPDEAFVAAIQRASREANRFPTVAMIWRQMRIWRVEQRRENRKLYDDRNSIRYHLFHHRRDWANNRTA